MISISLCMIVKDEEQTLERCLKSAEGFVDEIIVVDTGSSDRTKEIARALGAQVYDFLWEEDFSGARNFAFSKGTGDYLFWLDADDVISPGQAEALLELKKRVDINRPDMVMLKYAVDFDQKENPTMTFYRERLIKKDPLAVWQGKVHEAIPPFGVLWKSDILIEHRKMKPVDPARNLRILERMARSGEKMGPRELYYYGKELYLNRRYEEGSRILLQFLDTPEEWPEEKTDACRFAALCFYGLGQNKKALYALLLGLEYGVPRPELCCDLGWWFYERNRWEEAVFWYRQALSCRNHADKSGLVQERMWGYIPCLMLGACYEALGKKNLAERYRRTAGKLLS